jgi:hypothetical protein
MLLKELISGYILLVKDKIFVFDCIVIPLVSTVFLTIVKINFFNIFYFLLRHSLQIHKLLMYFPCLIIPSFAISGSTLSATCAPQTLQDGNTSLTILYFRKH